jgi:hypothetical protein
MRERERERESNSSVPTETSLDGQESPIGSSDGAHSR